MLGRVGGGRSGRLGPLPTSRRCRGPDWRRRVRGPADRHSEPATAYGIAKRIADTMARPSIVPGTSVSCQASIGVACSTLPFEPEQLLRQATHNMNTCMLPAQGACWKSGVKSPLRHRLVHDPPCTILALTTSAGVGVRSGVSQSIPVRWTAAEKSAFESGLGCHGGPDADLDPVTFALAHAESVFSA
jgi:hypothetical protein